MIAGLYGMSMFSFVEIGRISSKMAVPFFITISNECVSFVLHQKSALSFFCFSQPKKYVIASHCCLDTQFSDDK